MNNKYPNFSVLMSIYYKEKPEYLKLSMDSIFNQTVIPNEVVLVEDGKLTKELDKMIEHYEKKYKQLKVIKFDKNRGLGIALHDGLLKCTYDIVFRMDTDDICALDRFEKQLNVFESKKVTVVGSNIIEYDSDMKNINGYRVVPKYNNQIIKRSKKRNPMNHMTVGFLKQPVIDSGNYQDMKYFEDYYLWIRMIINKCTFYNIQENLVKVRGGEAMITRRGGINYIKNSIYFERKLLKLKFINIFEFMINVVERIIISLIPNKIRLCFYNTFLRRKGEKS